MDSRHQCDALPSVRILAISGSLQAHSSNLILLQTAAALADPGVDLVIFDALRALPHFDLDLEASEPSPMVQAWRRALTDSDALLIASPEYGFSLPGTLKNGIDWVIGSGELEGKVVAITTSVTTPSAGVGASRRYGILSRPSSIKTWPFPSVSVRAPWFGEPSRQQPCGRPLPAAKPCNNCDSPSMMGRQV